MEEREIFKRCIQTWGVDLQVMMAIEEMAELTKELLKAKRRGYTFGLHSHDPAVNGLALTEELVDAELMIDQLKYMFDVSGIEQRKIKLQRLEGLIAGY